MTGSGEVYLVYGTTGEWDDTYRWVAAACLDREQAEAFASQLQQIASELSPVESADIYDDAIWERHLEQQHQIAEKLREAGDSRASVDTNGVTYRVETAPLLSERCRSTTE